MADPLSIAAGIVGLGGVICKITTVLTNTVWGVRDAPSFASLTLREAEETSIIITRLQEYLLRSGGIYRLGAQHIQANHVVVLLSGCIETYSELESIIDSVGDGKSGLDRFKWAAKEDAIARVAERLPYGHVLGRVLCARFKRRYRRPLQSSSVGL